MEKNWGLKVSSFQSRLFFPGFFHSPIPQFPVRRSRAPFFTPLIHPPRPFFRAEFLSRDLWLILLYSWKLLTLSKRSRRATWSIPKKGGGSSQLAELPHSSKTNYLRFSSLAPGRVSSCNFFFFFRVEVSSSFVYPATGIFWEVSPIQNLNHICVDTTPGAFQASVNCFWLTKVANLCRSCNFMQTTGLSVKHHGSAIGKCC